VALDDPNPTRQKIKLIAAGVIFVVAGGVTWYSLGGKSIEEISAERAYMCSECGYVHEHILQMGERYPVECPGCDRQTFYPAEACYWTKGPDGQWNAKLEPTFVVCKNRIDPKTEEPTFCPDCGREVVGHNPPPPEDLMNAARAEAGR